MCINNQSVTIVNLYAPNTDEPQFFIEVFKTLAQHATGQCIIAGDFNLVMEHAKDSCNRINNNDKSHKVLQVIFEELDMVDVWRRMHRQECRYTHFNKQYSTHARLHYIFVNYALIPQITLSEISIAYKTDHCPIIMQLDSKPDVKRGPGLWKLNVALLECPQTIQDINKVIEEAIAKTTQNSSCARWEYIKMKFIQKLQCIAKQKASKLRQEFDALMSNIKKLIRKKELMQQNSFNVHPSESTLVDELLCSEQEKLNRHLEIKAKGARVRSKIKYYEEGEKSTKYFLNLERVRYCNKTITVLLKEDNTITKCQKEILNEQHKFYRNLYSKKPNIFFSLQNNSTYHLSCEQRVDLDQQFNFEEFSESLKTMPRGSMPGSDGLPSEFYIVFWTRIGKHLWETCLESHQKGELFPSAQKGVITLIPKKEKDPLLLKNWRPITLLNVDYKIITKMIANRLKTMLDEVIGPQQTAYIPGRSITYTIRKILDILMYLEQHQQDAVLITVDFKRCFDSIDHDALFASLEYFNLGPYVLSWIWLMYVKFELCVCNNGYCSQYFTQSHGVHQGCALSGPCFLGTAEVLAHMIKNNHKILAVRIGDNEEKIAQYADDTSLWSLNDTQSLEEIIKTLNQFKENTGLKVNYEKSKMFHVGKVRKPSSELKLSKKLPVSHSSIEMLGILINMDDLNDINENNLVKTLEKIENTLAAWR